MTSMAAILSTQEHEIRNLRLLLRKLREAMKIIRYVNPTARLTKRHQLQATDDFSNIVITITEGEDDQTIENALRLMRPRRGLLVHNVGILSRARKNIVEICERVFEKDCCIVESDGTIHTPDEADTLFSGIMLGKHLPKGSGKHGGHNRISDAKREAAFLLWQTPSLPNDEVARLAGISYQAMYKWWNEDYPREQKRGRKRKK
jgi:hypothetical protein